MCSFEYIRQPPSTTLDGCNPYSTGSNTVIISLECFVRIIRAIITTDEFEVRWFRENTTGAAEDLGLGHPDQFLGNSTDFFSRYHNTAFLNQPYSPSLLGKYWCQVINTTADPDQPLMRSNVFTLLAPENYSGAPCTKNLIQFVDNRTCADLLDNQLPVHSTTSVLPNNELQTPTITPTLPTPDDSPTITPGLPTPDDSPTITPGLPKAPATSVPVYVYVVPEGVLLVTILICCSGVILILVKRRRKTTLATAGQ